MTETAVKNKVCRHCGADVRPDTQFCYNCGGSLAPETGNGAKDSQPNAESNNDYIPKPTTKLEPLETADASVSKPAIAEEPKIEKESKTEEPQLQSAATMRRKSKIVEPKQVEVIWEEHENAPNLWFILAALLLTAFAAAIYYVAAYLK